MRWVSGKHKNRKKRRCLKHAVYSRKRPRSRERAIQICKEEDDPEKILGPHDPVAEGMCLLACGFFASPANNGYCSKCLKKVQNARKQLHDRKQAKAAAGAAGNCFDFFCDVFCTMLIFYFNVFCNDIVLICISMFFLYCVCRFVDVLLTTTTTMTTTAVAGGADNNNSNNNNAAGGGTDDAPIAEKEKK